MTRIFRVTATVLSLVFAATSAFAGSVLQPGSTAGLPTGSPLPEGVYFVNTSSYGRRTAIAPGLGVNLTSVVWATPFTAYDTRLQFVFLQPTVYTTNSPTSTFFANSTLFAGQLARTFGNGFGVSYLAGFRAGEPAVAAFHESSFEQRGAVSYTGDGFNLTANAANGVFKERSVYPDWFNLDLTATKKFDKLEVGAVAFGSTDLSSPTVAYLRQRQIAVGGLVGYNFGTFVAQAYVTRDVYQVRYTGYDTRGWLRLIVPLYKAPVAAAAEPIRARY